jgi:enamine deaminase RidA (YjgF/YER057c/UK114 family)
MSAGHEVATSTAPPLRLTAVHPEGYVRAEGRTTSSGIAVSGADGLVFLAGQVASDTDGTLVGRDDLATQLRQIYRNIEAVVRAVGADMRNVVSTRAYLAAQADVDQYKRTKAELSRHYWADGPYPANTMLVVTRLAETGYLAEIEAIAVIL